MLGALPQNQIALARRQLKKQLQHPIVKWYAEHELVGVLPVSNPFVLRAEEHPTIGLGLGLIQFHRKQTMRAQEFLPRSGFLFQMFALSWQLVFLLRMLPNLAFSLMPELIAIALQAPGEIVPIGGGLGKLTMT